MLSFKSLFEKTEKEKHEEIFNKLLKKYKAKELSDLSDIQKLDFFKELKKLI